MVAACALVVAVVAIVGFTMRRTPSSPLAIARIHRQGSSAFLGYRPMECLYFVLTPIAKLAASHAVSPDVFSWGCLVLGLGSGLAAVFDLHPLAGALIITAGLCDALDGMVARLEGVASEAGEVLDAAIDRYSEFFFLGGLCISYRHDVWAMVLAQAALLGSFLVSYSQAKAEAMQVPVPAGWMRRPERVAYLGVAALLASLSPYLLTAALMLVAVFANATAVHRFRVLYAHAKGHRGATRGVTDKVDNRR